MFARLREFVRDFRSHVPPGALHALPVCQNTCANRVQKTSGADGETRTPTGFPTTPSRWRVYQFHHVGITLGRRA